jgi:alkylation response protein AidB-like acyl-CoA dehydrogenase
MDFSLSEEQNQLRDSVSKFVADNCDVERHRRLSSSALGFDAGVWQKFAELGWLAIAFSEAQGGIGGNSVDVMVIAEALGRGLVREPFIHTAITCGAFLRLGANEAQQAQYIPGVIDGSKQWAFAFAEEGSGFEFEASRCSAQPADGGWRLEGRKAIVLNGHCADYLVVSARCPAEGDGLSVFIVDSSLPGITIEPFRSVDGSCGATVSLDAVQLDANSLLGEAGQAMSLIELVIDETIVAMGGEALGAMQALLDTTVEYTRTREQFGQPIGKFQALQHRMADMYLKVEELRSLLYNAAIAVSEGSVEAGQACAALKVKLAEAGKFVSQEAVQLHGGIGMTDELVVGHHFKRLMLLAKLYGDEDWYLQRYIELGR